MILKLPIFVFLIIIWSVPAENEVSDFFNSRCESHCIFSESSITSENLKFFPSNCSTVCANMLIDQNSNVPEEKLAFTFKNMKTLFGSLKVYQTNYTSGKFLAGIESFECDTDGSFTWEDNKEMTEIGLMILTRCACDVDVSLNNKMTKLNLPNLKNFSSLITNTSRQIKVLVYRLSPNFCISIEEMENFIINNNVYIKDIPEVYCNATANQIQGEKVCAFENTTLRNMETGCVRVRGNILVLPGDEEYLNKLQTVKYLFGWLHIKSTNFTSIELVGLEYVASLKEDNDCRTNAAIVVFYNYHLLNFSLPNLKRVRVKNNQWILFDGSSEDLFKSLVHQPICAPFMDVNNETVLYVAGLAGVSCDVMAQKIEYENSSHCGGYISLLVLASFLFLQRHLLLLT